MNKIALKNVRLTGGNLKVLEQNNVNKTLSSLYVLNGYSHGYVHDTHPEFPKLTKLYIDRCCSNYIFYHANKRIFPNLRQLYLRDMSYDEAALDRMYQLPYMTDIMYTLNNRFDSTDSIKKYIRHSEKYKQISDINLTRITDKKFKNIYKEDDEFTDMIDDTPLSL